jgi:hypothetical protein
VLIMATPVNAAPNAVSAARSTRSAVGGQRASLIHGLMAAF